MSLVQQFREVFRELRLIIEGRSEQMSRAELVERTFEHLFWLLLPTAVLFVGLVPLLVFDAPRWAAVVWALVCIAGAPWSFKRGAR